mgnify:CR=1 FL=1
MDEHEAICRLKAGDSSGLAWLVMRYQVKAMRTAFLITRDEQLSEDVVQEAFVRLFERIRSFDERRPFEPYLMRSVVNIALNALRTQGHTDFRSLDDLGKPLGNLLPFTNVEDEAEINALKEQMRRAIDQLSPRQRAAVVMRYYLEMSEKEIAKDLSIAPGTVKWVLNAARQRLRRLLIGERKSP